MPLADAMCPVLHPYVEDVCGRARLDSRNKCSQTCKQWLQEFERKDAQYHEDHRQLKAKAKKVSGKLEADVKTVQAREALVVAYLQFHSVLKMLGFIFFILLFSFSAFDGPIAPLTAALMWVLWFCKCVDCWCAGGGGAEAGGREREAGCCYSSP
jgi:hypothetical protein